MPFRRNHLMPRFPLQITLLAAALFTSAASLYAQEPSSGAAPQAPAAPSTPSAESSSKQTPGQNKGRHSNDFLVRGTVFTPEGLAFPGAELRIRRTSDKSFKWHDQTNSRGEFAIRVKMGSDYEVLARAKGFQDQALAVDAKTGERFKDVVFHMQRPEVKK